MTTAHIDYDDLDSAFDEPTTPEPFEYLDLEAAAQNGIPEIQWLLPGWIAERDIALLAGAGGVGKSTTTADLALALATGQTWCDLKPTRPLRVLFFDEEQGEKSVTRLFLRLNKGTPDTLRIASSQGLNLTDPDSIRRLRHAIQDHQAEIVFVDSIQQTFLLQSENDNSTLGPVYKALQAMRDSLGTTFFLIHHERKPPQEKGTTTRRIPDLWSIRGGTAHTTQPSTVWVATPGPSKEFLDLFQVKRREAEKLSLRIRYHAAPNGTITLSSEGKAEDEESQLVHAVEAIQEFVFEHDRGLKTGEIQDAMHTQGIARATVTKALKLMTNLGTLSKPERGWYVKGTIDPDSLFDDEPEGGRA